MLQVDYKMQLIIAISTFHLFHYLRTIKNQRKEASIKLTQMNIDNLLLTTAYFPPISYFSAINEADQIFNLLMGDVVEPRREYIEKHAAGVKDLDI